MESVVVDPKWLRMFYFKIVRGHFIFFGIKGKFYILEGTKDKVKQAQRVHFGLEGPKSRG